MWWGINIATLCPLCGGPQFPWTLSDCVQCLRWSVCGRGVFVWRYWDLGWLFHSGGSIRVQGPPPLQFWETRWSMLVDWEFWFQKTLKLQFTCNWKGKIISFCGKKYCRLRKNFSKISDLVKYFFIQLYKILRNKRKNNQNLD